MKDASGGFSHFPKSNPKSTTIPNPTTTTNEHPSPASLHHWRTSITGDLLPTNTLPPAPSPSRLQPRCRLLQSCLQSPASIDDSDKPPASNRRRRARPAVHCCCCSLSCFAVPSPCNCCSSVPASVLRRRLREPHDNQPATPQCCSR